MTSRELRLYQAGCLQASTSRHAYVHKHDVRARFSHLTEGFQSVRRSARHLSAAHCQQVGQPLCKQRMIVDYKDSHVGLTPFCILMGMHTSPRCLPRSRLDVEVASEALSPFAHDAESQCMPPRLRPAFAGLKPAPSSFTRTSTTLSENSKATRIFEARACFTAFVQASWMMRNSWNWTSRPACFFYLSRHLQLGADAMPDLIASEHLAELRHELPSLLSGTSHPRYAASARHRASCTTSTSPSSHPPMPSRPAGAPALGWPGAARSDSQGSVRCCRCRSRASISAPRAGPGPCAR